MAVRMLVFMKFEEWPDELSLGEKTPRGAFESIRKLIKYKGVEYADVLPIVDGEALLESRFKVRRGDNITEKFAGYHNVAA